MFVGINIKRYFIKQQVLDIFITYVDRAKF